MRTNIDRAYAAFDKIEGYGESWEYDTNHKLSSLSEEDQSMLEQQMSDLLCDMHHLADLADVDWEGLLARGDRHYQAEIVEHDMGL